jgi:2-oxoglutarate ferredoxin oxidoreductase subunit beta
VIDIISPCIAFNNHAGSTKSLDFVREHNEAVNKIDFIDEHSEITLDQEPGTVTNVMQHDGSILRLRKLAESYDPTDKVRAMNYLQERSAQGELVTGLLYINPASTDLHSVLNTVDKPLNQLGTADLCPGTKAIEGLNDLYR